MKRILDFFNNFRLYKNYLETGKKTLHTKELYRFIFHVSIFISILTIFYSYAFSQYANIFELFLNESFYKTYLVVFIFSIFIFMLRVFFNICIFKDLKIRGFFWINYFVFLLLIIPNLYTIVIYLLVITFLFFIIVYLFKRSENLLKKFDKVCEDK